MVELNKRELIYGIDFGKIIRPRSGLNRKLEKIVERGMRIPCEVEIFAEVPPWSKEKPEFNQITVIIPGKYINEFRDMPFNGQFEKYHVKCVSSEEYVIYPVKKD